jgi:hypothetical protein
MAYLIICYPEAERVKKHRAGEEKGKSPRGEFHFRERRRAGELLREMAERGERAVRKNMKSQPATSKLSDLGVTKTQSSRGSRKSSFLRRRGRATSKSLNRARQRSRGRDHIFARFEPKYGPLREDPRRRRAMKQFRLVATAVVLLASLLPNGAFAQRDGFFRDDFRGAAIGGGHGKVGHGFRGAGFRRGGWGGGWGSPVVVGGGYPYYGSTVPCIVTEGSKFGFGCPWAAGRPAGPISGAK